MLKYQNFQYYRYLDVNDTNFNFNATRINVRYFHWRIVIPKNTKQSCRSK